MHPYIYLSPSDNPHITLALEEALLDSLADDQIILYLYAHRDSVIIGRNQNAWEECRHDELAANGGMLARRISGGGAVFHDPQNLNFSFIVPRRTYDLERQLGVLTNAIRGFGIDARLNGRNDITANGRKFSGNAFCFREKVAFHHGTILINADSVKMARYLRVREDKLRTKGIKSVRSRVINLCELAPGITRENMCQALSGSFQAEYGTACELVPSSRVLERAAALSARNASWDWIFGKTHPFDVRIRHRFMWGEIDLQLALERGTVLRMDVFSDAINESFVRGLKAALAGCVFRSSLLAARIRDYGRSSESAMAEDIAELIESRAF